MIRAVVLIIAVTLTSSAGAADKAKSKQWTTSQICKALDHLSREYDLPRATFTRLIWTESRFDAGAISPVGAQGIAQFMPGTARDQGLKDPFDPLQALPGSAALLSLLQDRLGNFGLAAMAYNAGEGRVRRWLAGKSGLPFETRDYVAAITGQRAEAFRGSAARVLDFSLTEGKPFLAACEALPIRKTRARRIARVEEGDFQPWGVQVAGSFSQDRAMRSWTRVRAKLRLAIGDAKPRLYRQRTPRGVRSKWAVRLGASTRAKANGLCNSIRKAGGFCVVRRNR
ncbi:MAG: lytic transglycosylase domain-containing protein [Pseudomonadota bacterium]